MQVCMSETLEKREGKRECEVARWVVGKLTQRVGTNSRAWENFCSWLWQFPLQATCTSVDKNILIYFTFDDCSWEWARRAAEWVRRIESGKEREEVETITTTTPFLHTHCTLAFSASGFRWFFPPAFPYISTHTHICCRVWVFPFSFPFFVHLSHAAFHNPPQPPTRFSFYLSLIKGFSFPSVPSLGVHQWWWFRLKGFLFQEFGQTYWIYKGYQ